MEAARDACLAAPNMAEAHYAFGQAWMAAGKPERAEQAFALAAKLRPNFADAWVNFGLARYALAPSMTPSGRWAAPFKRSPATPRRRAISRRCSGLTGYHEVSETLLREALARDPHDAGARLNLVAERLQEEHPAEALALLNAVDPPADNLSRRAPLALAAGAGADRS